MNSAITKNLNSVAIVTGGRRGIGRSIALALAEKNFKVLIVDLENDAAAKDTISAIKSLGGSAKFEIADIGDESTHARILDTAESLGQLCTLVNNAGVSSLVRGDMLSLPVESLDRSWRVNVRAPFLLSQAFASRLLDQALAKAPPFRSIINITSSSVEILGLNRADYCMTKAAGSMMTRLFAARLADEGVHVYEVRPGIIATEMTQPSRERYDQAIENGMVPMRRWGSPDDVGEAVASLVSGAFRYSTGDAIRVDGGLHMYRI